MAPRFENIISRLRESIAVIFDQAQLTLANHRKNCVALYKLHQQAATIIHCSKKDNVINLVGERAFGDAFIDMVNRVLVVQKGPATVDRVVRFMGSYVKFMNEKGMWILAVAAQDWMYRGQLSFFTSLLTVDLLIHIFVFSVRGEGERSFRRFLQCQVE